MINIKQINVVGHNISYKGISASYPKHLKKWTHVVLSHSYANELTMLYVNGKLVGKVKEQLEPNSIYFGGTSVSTEMKDLTLHRSCLNDGEALDLFNKKFIQSSLEFYNPLTKPIEGNILSNEAQSMTVVNIDKQVKINFSKVSLY